MLDIRELIRRLQLGETDRQIARDLQVSRKTVSKYRAWAQQQEVLTGPLPDPATLQTQLKTTLPVSTPPATPSKVMPFRDHVIALRQRGVECRAIFDILREEHAFAGSYGSVYRFVRHLEPRTPDACVRVDSGMQISNGRLRANINWSTGHPAAVHANGTSTLITASAFYIRSDGCGPSYQPNLFTVDGGASMASSLVEASTVANYCLAYNGGDAFPSGVAFINYLTSVHSMLTVDALSIRGPTDYTGTFLYPALSLGAQKISNLPVASSVPGSIAFVEDSTAVSPPNEGQTCAGGSSHNALAFSNGSVWKCF